MYNNSKKKGSRTISTYILVETQPIPDQSDHNKLPQFDNGCRTREADREIPQHPVLETST